MARGGAGSLEGAVVRGGETVLSSSTAAAITQIAPRDIPLLSLNFLVRVHACKGAFRSTNTLLAAFFHLTVHDSKDHRERDQHRNGVISDHFHEGYH